MKMYRCLLWSFFLIVSTSSAQTFSVFGAKSTTFPAVKALFYAKEAQGKRLNLLTPASFTVTENSTPCRVLSVTCPPDSPPLKISSVLVMDVSGSMAGGSPVPNMGIAKAAGRAWIRQLPTDGSECAVSSFDNNGYLNQDFTTDKTLLTSAIDALAPSGGTNYNAGFIDANGAVNILTRAKHRRIAVFLTDGQGSVTEQDVINQASANGITVYCVGVNFALPLPLKTIAEQTGGAWFENVGSAASIEEIYSRILDLAVSGPPCEIEWETTSACSVARTATIQLNQHALKQDIDYIIAPINLPNVTLSILSARFPNVPPGKTDVQDVTVTAVTDSIVITSVTSLNNDFTIENPPSPVWNLKKGESKTFRVRFTPTDSSLTFAEIKVLGNMCFGTTMYAIGGYSGFRKPSAQLRVVAPNGGERFAAGDTTTLRWTGVLPIDTVRLEYSIDAGVSWLPITTKAGGLQYQWLVPQTPSNQCILRATQYRNRGMDTVIFLDKQPQTVTGACFSPDGARVATISWNGSLRLWDATNGTMIFPPIQAKTSTGYCIDWSPDGQRIAVGNNGVELYDGASFSYVQHIDSGTIASCAYTRDGLYLITNNSVRNKIGIFSMQTQNLTQLSSGHTGGINHVSVVSNLPQKFSILTASGDRSARRIALEITQDDITNGMVATSTASLDFTSTDVGVAYIANPTDSGSACAAFRNGDLVFYPTKTIVRPFGGDAVNEADWSPDGKSIAFALNSGVLAIMDVASKKITRLLDTVHKSALSIRWDATSTKVVAGYTNNLALIWQVSDLVDQQDISDNVWEITVPVLNSLQSVDLGSVRINSSHDSLVQSILCVQQNPLSTSKLDSALIYNDPDGVFRIVSGVPATFAPQLPACVAIEVGFTPKKLGPATAMLRMYSNGKFFDVALKGNGVDIELTYPDLVIDFGKIPVGMTKDTLINPAMVNVGSLQLFIATTSIAGPDKKQFIIIGGDTAIRLSSMQSSRLLLRFAPQILGRTSSRVKIDFTREGMIPTVGTPVYLQLYGEGICGFDSTRVVGVALGNEIQSVVGAIVEVPVVFKLQPGLSRDMISQRVYCSFSFAADMLLPVLPLPVGTLDKSTEYRRSVSFEADRLPNSDTLLLLPLLTMLGSDSTVTVRIDTLYFNDGGCPLTIKTDSVTIKLTDLCTAGGATRLLAGAPTTQVILRPNPASDNPTILLTLAEDTPVTLTLLSMLGQEVRIIEGGYKGRGNHLITVDASDIAAGVYSLRLTTRSEVKVVPFIKR